MTASKLRDSKSFIAASLALGLFGASCLGPNKLFNGLTEVDLKDPQGESIKLKRGGVVPDSRVIRTLKTGNVEFERGNESVTIGPNTQLHGRTRIATGSWGSGIRHGSSTSRSLSLNRRMWS